MAPKKKQVHIPTVKDDGTRWQVVRDGKPVYDGQGVMKSEAMRLCEGLLDEASIVQVS